MTDFLKHRPRAVQIFTARSETPSVRSLTFKDEMAFRAQPGQFVMLWIPGSDEIPLSLVPLSEEGLVRVAVKNRGEGSRALLAKDQGDLIGVRGPYGNSFTHSDEERVLLIAGGTGTVPLLALLQALLPMEIRCSFILGAETADELLFASEIRELAEKTRGLVRFATEDGSTGEKGLATDLATKVLQDHSFDRIYTCGPEAMMRKVVNLGRDARIPVQAGLERIFKCGSGICGSCCIGPYLVCKDGPVFDGETLSTLLEFGAWTRDHSGRRLAQGTR